MTTFKLITAAAVAAFLAFPAQAQDKAAKRGDKAQMSKQDRQALSRLAQGDMAEVAAGKVAAEKASSPEVKKFGQHMVDEHTKMLEEGKQVAEAKGVTPPAGPDKKHQAALKKLEQLSGEEFDRQFMAQMVKDHEDALKLAEKTAKDAKDPQVKEHAQKGAPHIKEHLAQARKLHGSLGASAGSSGAPAKKK
jgi:putative membrane protein